MQKMRQDIFKARRDAISKQLTITFNNLNDIKARIETRIVFHAMIQLAVE